MRPVPTAPIAAGSLIAGFGVAVASGSRPLGGVVMLAGGAWCMRAWAQRRGPRTAAALTAVAFTAFVVSHVLALAIGAWPSVLVVSAVTAAASWIYADSRPDREELAPLAFRRPAR